MESSHNNIVQRNIKLSYDDVRWFDENYPGSSLSGILGLLLGQFRMLHQTSPADMILKAAQDVKEGLE